MKPDSTRAAIVEAIRKVGGQWFDTESVAGFPDGVWSYQGRMGLAELKAEGKQNGVCGCTHSDLATCGIRSGHDCHCKGHMEPKGERLVWHRQLMWREAWKGPPVSTWTTPEEALRTIALANGEARERAEAEVAKLRVDMEEMVAAAGRHTELDARLERWLERMPVLEAHPAAIPEGTPATTKGMP